MRTQSVQVNDQVERLVLVSDLHGFIEPLKVLDRVIEAYPEKVQVVAVGDYVVTGSRPAEAVEWVRRNAGRFAVRGNHDEGALAGAEGEHPPWTEPGAYVRLSCEQKEYLSELPDILELSWKGRRIRITHGRRPSGEWVAWTATASEVFEFFADPSVELTVVGHTHHAFVRTDARCCVANCGSTSHLILGFKQDDGTVESRTEAPFEPVSEMYSTYLSVTIDESNLEVRVERFDYDRQKEIQRLRDAGRLDIKELREQLETCVW